LIGYSFTKTLSQNLGNRFQYVMNSEEVKNSSQSIRRYNREKLVLCDLNEALKVNASPKLTCL